MNNTTETNYDDMSEMVENSDINKSGCRLITAIIIMCFWCGLVCLYSLGALIDLLQKHFK